MKTEIPSYDINSFEEYKNRGILVARFDNYLRAHGHLRNAHRHTFYHLVYFTEGTGNQQIDFEHIPIEPHQIYFMRPGQVHQWVFDENPTGYIINFSGDYFTSFLLEADYIRNFTFFKGDPGQQVIRVDETFRQKLCFLFEDILAEGAVLPPPQDDLVRTLLLQIFIGVSRHLPSAEASGMQPYRHQLVDRFKDLIEVHFMNHRFPKEYAQLLYVSPGHLNSVCISQLGKSAGTLIRDRVLLEAKRLLTNLELNVSEVSDRLNFKDQSYFIKFFKNYENITPDKFRNQTLLQWKKKTQQ